MPQAQDYPDLMQAMLKAVQRISQRHWCPATGGNFSARIDHELRLITRSGCDKNQLGEQDWMLCDRAGHAIHPTDRPSDEAQLHARIYQLEEYAQCVLHSHSVNATVLSRQHNNAFLAIHGFEMQKALGGHKDPEQALMLPILDNNQNIAELADQFEALWRKDQTSCPGLLVRGHGLYAWGENVEQALRHLEGLEFLIECLWQERLLAGTKHA